MARQLVIAEKLSVARDIAKALGNHRTEGDSVWFENDDYYISFAVGHLLELEEPEGYDEKWKNWSIKKLPIVPPNNEFRHKPKDSRAKKRLSVLLKLAKKKDVDGLINACDAGREGELIFRTIQVWIQDQMGKELPTQRLWLSSLTQSAIRDGFENLEPSSMRDDLGDAAYCRSESDWLIGMNATRALTRRLKSLRYDGPWTAGRVQTPTLSMLVDRELKIYDHRPRDYWEISATFGAPDHEYDGIYYEPKLKDRKDPETKATRIFDHDRVVELVAALGAAKSSTARESRKNSKKSPPLPVDLTTLQREANNRFGFSAKRTLDIAQRLYEAHKVLSYPRTDSRYLPVDYKDHVEDSLNFLLKGSVGKDAANWLKKNGLQNVKKVFNDKKVRDHFAIIPVAPPKSGQLKADEEKIFELVVRFYLAAFMNPAIWTEIVRTSTVSSAEDLTFRTTGRVLKEEGWELAFDRTSGYSTGNIPKILNGDGVGVELIQWAEQKKETRPPGRLTEAGLLSRMENAGREVEEEELSEVLNERGLGTPATRADTIERLIQKTYVSREGKTLRPTAKGIRLVDILQSADSEIALTSVDLTGGIEMQLRQVAGGEKKRSDFMDEMINQTTNMVEWLVNFDFDDLYPQNDLGEDPEFAGNQVRETMWGFSSESDGDGSLFIWKDFRGHILQPAEISVLLAEKTVGPLTLFHTRGRNTSYKALVRLQRVDDTAFSKLKEGKRSRWKLEAVPIGEDGQELAMEISPEEEEEEVEAELGTFNGLQIVKTNKRWVDSESVGSSSQKAQLPLVVCEREMAEEEAIKFFTDKKTDLLENFISRRGRPFKAKLFLKKNGRHGFEFENRTAGKKSSSSKKKK